MPERLIDVALPLPLQAAFTYRVPESQALPSRGCRVRVPFASRHVIGLVTGPGRARAGVSPKDVLEVVDEVPLVGPTLLDLADFVAQHYLAPPGECYRLLLPPAGIRASRARVRLKDASLAPEDPLVQALADGPLTVARLAHRLGRGDVRAQLSRLRAAGAVTVEQDLGGPGFREPQVAALVQPDFTPRGAAQAEVLKRLQQEGGRLSVAELARERPGLRAALGRLVKQGAVRVWRERELRTPEMLPEAAARRPAPLPDQVQVIDQVQQALTSGCYGALLLHGVTGSGKTEIYLRCIQRALDQGKTAIMMVPEISLTPQTVSRAW